MMISTLLTQDATIMAPKFTFKPNPQAKVLFNLNIHHCHFVVNKNFPVFHCAYD